ncbi:MAG: hypothetical protein KDD46_04155 [Bdellovibrionales bacterium]|nr:hypothetical protein [Bdellovibrionales bacterium]
MSAEQFSSFDKFWFKFKRRRKKYVDPKQQSRLAFEILLMVVVLPSLFYIFTISELWTTIFFGSQAETIRGLFYSHLILLKKAWHVIFLILLFIVFLSIYFTHKIFGPMVRFQKVLEAKLKGEGDIHFTLRRGDYFQDFSKIVQQIALSKIEVPKEVLLRSEGQLFDMTSDKEASSENHDHSSENNKTSST